VTAHFHSIAGRVSSDAGAQAAPAVPSGSFPLFCSIIETQGCPLFQTYLPLSYVVPAFHEMSVQPPRSGCVRLGPASD
jgi:hypothetical protein